MEKEEQTHGQMDRGGGRANVRSIEGEETFNSLDGDGGDERFVDDDEAT
jgi:hypothetical protein